MSARLGTPLELLSGAAKTTSLANGLSLNVLPSSIQWAILNSVSITWVNTATVGSRQYLFSVKDAAGNLLLSQVFSATAAASQTVFLQAGAAEPLTNTTVGTKQWMTAPIPGEFSVPAGASIQIQDIGNAGAGFDVNDTAIINAIIVY
jgi:hypothetical protein